MDYTKGWICWWYFKISGLKVDQELTLEVKGMDFALADHAVFSTDNKTWKQTERAKIEKGAATYKIKSTATELWIAWGPPFTLSDAQSFVDATVKAAPYAKAFELCKSTEGRSVPALRITESEDPKRFGIWISARQHAWESGASWVCKGLVEWLVSDDPRAVTLRKKTCFHIVPVMDSDSVERGAGGKGQKPNDHNRDWTETPHWPEVRAAQAIIKEQNEKGCFDLYIDLHNPGPRDKDPYYYISPADQMKDMAKRNLAAFLEQTKTEMTGPLAYKGRTIECGTSYDKDWKAISQNWVMFNCAPHVFGVTLETAWNMPASTAENYQRVGKELGLAMELYFRADVRK